MRDFRPSLFGKLNTLTQIIALIAVLCGKVFASPEVEIVRDGLIRAIKLCWRRCRLRNMRGLMLFRRINGPGQQNGPQQAAV